MKQDGRLKLRPGVLKGTALVLEKVVGPTTKTSWWKCECQVCKHVSVRAANALNTEPKSCGNCIYEQRRYAKKTLQCPSCKKPVVANSNLRLKYCSKKCKLASVRHRDTAKRQRTIEDTITSVLHGIKSRASRRGLECDLTKEFLLELLDKQHGRCARTGRILEKSDGLSQARAVSNTVSVDRIDSDRGYTKDNVQLVTYNYNTAKNVMTDGGFLDMCKEVLTKAGYTVSALEVTVNHELP